MNIVSGTKMCDIRALITSTTNHPHVPANTPPLMEAIFNSCISIDPLQRMSMFEISTRLTMMYNANALNE
jgi:hypothetical protein